MLHVPDPFLLSSLSSDKSASPTDQFGRALANKRSFGKQINFAAALRAPLGRAADLNRPV
jgi:hypothetical protein